MTTVFGALRNLIVNNYAYVLAGGAGLFVGRYKEGLWALLPGGKLGKCLQEYEERMKKDREAILQNEHEEQRQAYSWEIQDLRGHIATLENQKRTK